MPSPPCVLFDLNGTLTDPAPIGDPWRMPDLGRDVLAGAVEGAMVDTILGEYRPFAEHVESSLGVLVEARGLDPHGLHAALEQASQLPAFADADVALSRLTAAGRLLAVLTNSGADGGRRTLEAAGLARHFWRILGVDAVERFKPDPRTYAYAVRELARQPSEITFVAAHAWDIAGAKRAGFTTVLIARDGSPAPSAFPPPDLLVADLSGAAAAILAG